MSWLSVLPAIAGAAADVGAMLFNKHQADTAHQREVADLRAAGLNPMLSVMGGRGSPVPDTPDLGGNVQRGLNSGLALQRQKSELALLDAQTAETRARAQQTAVETSRTQAMTPLEMSNITSRTDVSNLDADQRRALLPSVVERVRADILATTASARRSSALAVLDELARTGAVNLQELESDVGEFGPMAKLLIELLRGVRSPK